MSVMVLHCSAYYSTNIPVCVCTTHSFGFYQYDIYDVVVVLIPKLRWIWKKANRTFETTCWRHNCLLLYFSPWTKKLVWYSVFICHRIGNVTIVKYTQHRVEETQWIWRWVICEWSSYMHIHIIWNGVGKVHSSLTHNKFHSVFRLVLGDSVYRQYHVYTPSVIKIGFSVSLCDIAFVLDLGSVVLRYTVCT